MTTTIQVYDFKGKVVGSADLPEHLFAARVDKTLLHEAVRAEEAAQRLGTADTRTRSDVSGGGKKPWRQKGTGRARHGSTRSPIWRKGGTVFGPHPRDYAKKMNRKEKRQALAGALSARFSEERVVGLEAKGLDKPMTKSVAQFIAAFESIRRPLFVHTAEETALAKSIRNIPDAEHRNVQNMSPRMVLLSDLVIFTPAAIEALGRVLPRSES